MVGGMMLKQIHGSVVTIGSRIDGRLVVALLLMLQVAWVVMLRAIGGQFEAVAGYPLLDLQNGLSPETIITPTKVMGQIATYSQEAKTLYWVFFILDNVMPQLAFGLFALVWVRFFRSNPGRRSEWLLGSPIILIPLGVGFFDWIENLGYIAAIHEYPGGATLPAIYVGLAAKWVKAICLQLTFLLTLPMLGYTLFRRLRRGGQPQAGIREGLA